MPSKRPLEGSSSDFDRRALEHTCHFGDGIRNSEIHFVGRANSIRDAEEVTPNHLLTKGNLHAIDCGRKIFHWNIPRRREEVSGRQIEVVWFRLCDLPIVRVEHSQHSLTFGFACRLPVDKYGGVALATTEDPPVFMGSVDPVCPFTRGDSKLRESNQARLRYRSQELAAPIQFSKRRFRRCGRSIRN